MPLRPTTAKNTGSHGMILRLRPTARENTGPHGRILQLRPTGRCCCGSGIRKQAFETHDREEQWVSREDIATETHGTL